MIATVSGRHHVYVFTIINKTSDEVQAEIDQAEGTIDLLCRRVQVLPSDLTDVDAGDGAVIEVDDENDGSSWIATVTDVEDQDNPRYVLVELEIR